MADKSTMKCVVAVPNRQLFSGEIYYASVPSVEGQYGVLPGHELVLTLNKKGGVCTLHLDESGNDKFEVLLYDGVAQFDGEKLTILGRLGKLTSRIDLSEMESRASAQEKIVADLESQSNPDDEESVSIEMEKDRLQWYNLQVEWAKNNKK